MGGVTIMSSIGWVIAVRFTVFCNVHRPKCMQNEFTKNGRQRKVQYRGGRLNQSRRKVSDFRASWKVYSLCQKLSCLSRQLSCLSRLVFVSPSLELSDALLLFVMISQRFVLPSALGFEALNRLKIWPHNGPYLRLLEILYVTFSRVTRQSLVEFLVKFSVRFVVWFWPFLCLF